MNEQIQEDVSLFTDYGMAQHAHIHMFHMLQLIVQHTILVVGFIQVHLSKEGGVICMQCY